MRCSERRRAPRATLHLACLGGLALAWPLAAQPSPEAPPPFASVQIDGNHVLGDAELRGALELPFASDSLEARLRRLARLYYDQGYLDAAIRPQGAGPGVLRLGIEEGEPARLARVHLRGTHVVPEKDALLLLGFEPGGRFRPTEVEARLEALVDAYARRGRLDTEAVIERLEIDSTGVVLGIAVSEGERATLAEVTVQGATTTRPQLVRRLAGLQPPQPAESERIREAPLRLRRSGLFSEVREPVLYRTDVPGQIGVLLHVAESERRHTFFGGVGLARDPGRDRPYLAGSVDLALRNIYGSGRDLSLLWQRDARTGSRLALAYRERFLIGTPLDFALTLSQNERDSTSTWQSLGLVWSLPLQRLVAVEFGGGLDRSVYHIVSPGNTLRLRARLGVRLATLGREEDGGHFGAFEAAGEYARRRNDRVVGGVPDRARVGQTIWSGRFEAGLPLARRHVLAARGEWHVVASDVVPVPESELYDVGGAQSVRGYRERQFQGDRVAFGGVEYRFGDPRGARLFAFVDAATFGRRRSDGSSLDDRILGYGAGLRAAVATGTLDLAVGLGDQEPSASALKLHVSLLQRF